MAGGHREGGAGPKTREMRRGETGPARGPHLMIRNSAAVFSGTKRCFLRVAGSRTKQRGAFWHQPRSDHFRASVPGTAGPESARVRAGASDCISLRLPVIILQETAVRTLWDKGNSICMEQILCASV